MEVYFLSFLTFALDEDEWPAGGNTHYGKGRRVKPTVGFDAVEKRKISVAAGYRNPGSSARRLATTVE
jgi:hypothetical protein